MRSSSREAQTHRESAKKMSGLQLTVASIFKSIQGEGTAQGLPCSFIRLAGCNLDCSYCDTKWAHEEGTPMSLTKIMQEIDDHGCQLVTVTGGEPLLNDGCHELLQKLVDSGKSVILETNGSVPLHNIHQDVTVVIDVKCPGSHMEKYNDYDNLKKLRSRDEVKFVLSNRDDYDFACHILAKGLIPESCAVLFSPVWGKLDPAKLAQWILTDGLHVRLNLQLHKVIWTENDGKEH